MVTVQPFRLRLSTLYSYDREHTTTAIVSLDNACFLLYIPDNSEPAYVQKIAEDIVFQLKEQVFDSILALEDFIGNYIKANNFPLIFTFACVYLNGAKAYLKTHGEGEIHIVRGEAVHRLLTGTEHAVGPVQIGDMFILTTKNTTEHISEMGGWSKFTTKNTDHISESLSLSTSEDISQKDLLGFVHVVKEDADVIEKNHGVEPTSLSESKLEKGSLQKTSLIRQLKNIYTTYRNRRTATFTIIFIIGILLLWSVGHGVRERSDEAQQKRVEYTRDLVTQKLQQAQDIVSLNSARAIVLVNEAKQEVADLKQDGIDEKSTHELNELIRQGEEKMFKKEDKKAEEFYDLSLENTRAKGTRFALSEENLTILDESGFLYTLDIDKKSISKINYPKAKNTVALAADEDTQFVVLPDGIYRIEGKNAKKIIDKDKDWDIIRDVQVYGGNIYLLDQTNNQIYKYPGSGDGVYGDKSNYFRGNAPGMATSQSVSFAIDGSIYISTDESLSKYTAGVADSFKVQFPSKVTMSKVVTSVNDTDIYVWDRTHASIYVISKLGNFKRHIQSSMLKDASDVVVYKENAYLLSGQKIYKLSLGEF